jgi:hypothetical protein
VEILSSISGDKNAARGKRIWVSRELGPDTKVNLASNGPEKAKWVKSKYDILIDDLPENIKKWNEAGGAGILHKNVLDTKRQLDILLSREEQN